MTIKTTLFLTLPVLLAAITAASFAEATGAANRVSGSVTVAGKKVPLSFVYLDESPRDIVVVLSAKEIPRDVLPFIGEDVARKQKIHAIVFTVSRSQKALDARGFGGVFYPGPETGSAVFPADAVKLDVEKLDATGLEGRIQSTKPFTSFNVEFSFDATFSLLIGSSAPPQPVPVISVTGDTSPPAKAYAEYYRTTFTGNEKTIAPSFNAERRKKFAAGKPEERSMMLDMMKKQPVEIKITKATVKGTIATLVVEGQNETATRTTGEISMTLEDGSWKVGKEKWSVTSK